MIRKKIGKSDDAIVGIIVAVLLIGLVLSVVSLIQTVFIPNWMEEIEADHMGEISDQIAQLKFAIDIQTALNISDIPIDVPITLGSNNLPYLSSARAYGNLEIIPNEVSIYIDDGISTINDYLLGVIKYSSINNYFINQDYTYESGSVIISQYEGDIMSTLPNFNAIFDGYNMTVVEFTIVDIVGVGNKLSASGFGNFPIRVEFSKSDNSTWNDIKYINITSENYQSWNIFLENILINAGLDSSNYTITSSDLDEKLSIEFADDHILNLNVKEIEIYAQIAPGWID